MRSGVLWNFWGLVGEVGGAICVADHTMGSAVGQGALAFSGSAPVAAALLGGVTFGCASRCGRGLLLGTIGIRRVLARGHACRTRRRYCSPRRADSRGNR